MAEIVAVRLLPSPRGAPQFRTPTPIRPSVLPGCSLTASAPAATSRSPRAPLSGFRCRRHCWNPLAPLPFSLPDDASGLSTDLSVSCAFPSAGRRTRGEREEPVRARKKENVWSVDNDLAAAKASAGEKTRKHRRRRGRRVRSANKRSPGDRVLVSGSMLMEIETVLQTQEPVIKPSWDTFASSVSGIWKGVGAVFSPFTAEMEPIGIGKKNENLYDCYTRSILEKVFEDGLLAHIRTRTSWAALNPFGEVRKHGPGNRSEAKDGSSDQETAHVTDGISDLPGYESFDWSKGEDVEEDVMVMEPGLVFFEDGSYSKGPADIPVGDCDESKHFLSPTFKFKQCLVKGCHKRLRMVHTIEFNDGGSSIQIIRVAVYEEE